MLSDDSINLAMNLLHQQFPEIGGLTDTSIGKCQQFDIVPSESKYIQILHAGSLHWICVANMEEDKSSNQAHYIYDSLVLQRIKQDAIQQIAAYSFSQEDELLLHIMPVQQQKKRCRLWIICSGIRNKSCFRGRPFLYQL